MKKLFTTFICSLYLLANAQNITQAEYFINTDPGVGNGIPVTVNPAAPTAHFTFNAPTGVLPPGFYNLCFRVKDDNGIWGLYESRNFYITTASQDADMITAAEFFIDTDPGVGNGTSLGIGTAGNTVNFSAAVPTASLHIGFHNLCIRTKDANGKWGNYESRSFYISSSSTDVGAITAAEFFIDTDPGVGNGTNMSIGTQGNMVSFSAGIPTTSLVAGFHNMCIRTKDANGKWGAYESRSFYITTSTSNASPIIAAECFLDVDPGVGNGSPITITTAADTVKQIFICNIPTTTTTGNHMLFTRVKNAAGQWGLYDSALLKVVGLPTPTLKPGSGNAISFDGVDDHIIAPEYLIPTSGDFTVEFWVNNRSVSGFKEFISQGSSGDAFYVGISGISGNIRCGDTWQSTGVSLPINQWVHVAVSKSGTNGTLYINGIQSATKTNYTISAAGTKTFIGKQYGGLAEFPEADLDEVRIWNTALTETQIRDRMCRKITSGDALFTNLAAYYNFDESTGTTAFDGSVNVNDGTLVNGPTRVTSGAAIGNSSTFIYGGTTVNLAHPQGENLTVNNIMGSPTGVHIYRVDQDANTNSGIAGAGNNNRYFGVHHFGGTNTTYNALYNYNGNPAVNAGTEAGLKIFKRTNNAATIWIDANATLNTISKTLQVTGTSTEYKLGSTSGNLSFTPGKSLHLDGNNDHIDLGNWFTYQTFTIEMWVNPGATQQQYADIIDNNHTGGHSWVFQQDGNNTNSYVFGGGFTGIAGINLAANSWQHVAIVATPTTKKVYVNGVLVGSSNGGNIPYGSQFFRIGSWGGGGRNWNGSMDALSIWDRDLSQPEIQAHLSCHPIPGSANLISYYDFNQGNANDANPGITTLTDAMGIHNGSLNNFALTGTTSNWTDATSGAVICAGNVLTPGNIGTNQTICSPALAVLLSSNTPAFTNSGNPIIYQWQDSIATGTWQNITSANTITYQPPSLLINTWYRRKANSGTLNAISNEVVITVNIAAGNSVTYPQDVWNFYAYDGSSVDSVGIGYRGFYTRNTISFNTTSDFNSSTTPASATGYAGCPIAAPNNIWSIYAKRKGFPVGPYILTINSHDDNVKIFKDGVEVISGTCCNTLASTTITLGTLDANTKLEARLANAGAPGNLQITLTQQALNAGSIGNNQTICGASVPAILTNITGAFGGATNIITYQWQDSTVGNVWQNIVSASGVTYQPPSLSASTWYRRIATNGAASVASNEIKITMSIVAGNPSIFPQDIWNFYAYDGGSVDSASIIYRGFYSRNSLGFNTNVDFVSSSNPSTATGYTGCPLIAPSNIWTLHARRKGFPAGPYILNINNHDDNVKIFKDGVELFSAGCCNNAATINISLGNLNANTQLEARVGNSGGGPGNLQITISMQPLVPGIIAASQTGCINFVPALLSSTEAAYGGPATTQSYQWQDSTIGGTWQNIVSATNLIYQPVSLSTSTWYRRKAISGIATAFSNEVAITILTTGPAFIPGISIANRTLTASALAAGTSGYQWYKNNISISGAINQTYTVADAEFGNFSVAYTNSCLAGNASNTITVAVAKTNQTITFTTVPTKTYLDAPFVVNATSSSSLPISTYSIVSGPATIIGNTVTITGAGIIVVKASQDGNATFNPAENNLSITVNKAAATVVLSNLSHVYDGTQKQAIATTNPLGLNTQLAYNSSTIMPAAAGNYNVVATITSVNYQGSGTAIMVITKGDQTIQLTNPGNKNFNDVPFGINALATSGLPVSFVLQTVPATGVASVSGSIITLLGGGGTVTIIASQAGSTNYNAATSSSITFNVNPPSAKDVQVIAKLAPANGCTTGLNAPITVAIRNTGTAAATNFPVSFRIGNEPTITETFTGTIAPNSNANYTFATSAVFPQTNVEYALTINTSLAGDEKPNNDTLLTSVIRFAPAVMTISQDTAICLGGTATLKTFGAGTTVWTGGPTNTNYSVSPITTTTYTATVTDINNCSTKILTTKVTVNPVPAVDAGVDQTIFRGSTATLLATGAASYIWSNGNNTAANVVAPQNTTNYTVTGTNSVGCKATDAVMVTVNFSAIGISPSLLQFGGVVVDSSKTTYITITNNGNIDETISSITGLVSPFTSSISLPINLPAGTSIQIPVKFSPTATLFYQTNMNVGTTAGNFIVVIRGTGADAAPAWTVTPAAYNFGKVAINTFVTANLAIKNTGNVSIRISSVSSSSVRYTGTTNGVLNIPVGGTVNLAVRFNPTAITSNNGSITVKASTANLAIIKPIVDGQGFVPGPLPTLQFLSRSPLNGMGGVSPKVAGPGNYTYSILYKHSGGLAPMSGFPKVGIDKNHDGDYADVGEGIFSMTKEGNSNNWTAGEIYNYTTNLGVSELYAYQFFATDVNNNEADATDSIDGPLVTREILDLHIFASDITFSMVNPAVNQNFTVTAKINNNSPYAAANVPIMWYYKDSIFLYNDTIPLIDGQSVVTLTRTLNFTPDGFYPIKVWIDSAHTLPEGNILNNYASRPVIVGAFTVPGTIDLISNAASTGCNRGKITFTGSATYRGLNLVGTPPVEGAEVTITISDRPGGSKVIKTTTDINGNWYYYDDPCADNPGDASCEGYICGTTYHYTVEVTDFTLTSPTVSGSTSRPCTQCNRISSLQQSVGVSNCILPEVNYSIFVDISNYEIDQTTGLKLCAPSVYRDTITIFVNGQLVKELVEDSITTCGSKSYSIAANGLPKGNHQVTMNHTYYFASGERIEKFSNATFEVLSPLTDISEIGGISKTGHTSFAFSEKNITCGVTAGPHTVYLYDSLPGYTEKVLIDSFRVLSLAPYGVYNFSYSNPLLAPGCHFITFILDAQNELVEVSKINNIGYGQFCVSKPDLVFSPRLGKNGNIITSVGSGNAGTLINFSTKIANIGAAHFSPFKVVFKAGGTILGTPINIPALDVGQELNIVSAPYTVPTSLCPVQITAKVDNDDQVNEERETNNFDTTYYGVNITAGRSCDDEFDNIGSGFMNDDDPVGTSLCLPYYATQNVLTYFSTTVRNTGSRDAKNVKVQFKLNGTVLGTDVIPLLKAGARTESGFYYAFDSVRRCIVNAITDYTKEICELNEMDNIGNIHIDVKRSVPDLEILSQYIAPSNLNPNPGQSITIVSSVINKGDGAAIPSKLRFWVNDVPLGDDIQIDSLYPGQDTTVMATLTYTSTIVGPKIIKATADINKQVAEKKEGNNEATRAIIVGAAPDFARAKSEAITLNPAGFNVGDTITIKHYIRNYGGDAGAAWVRFYYRVGTAEKVLIDSVRLGLGSNDSTRIGLRWKVAAPFGQIITEIANAIPPEFNDQNNVDSLLFGTSLPLTLLYFNGTVRNEEALLNWRTTDEINLQHFELERSVNANRFTKIAILNANNNQGQHSYQYSDVDFGTLPTTNVYYRLKIVDNDGQYRYSNIIKLGKKQAIQYVKVYPNPVKQMLMVQVEATTAGAYSLRVMDAAGKQCLIKEYQVNAGLQTLSIPVYMLAQGSYLLVMQQSDGSTTDVKFIKD